MCSVATFTTVYRFLPLFEFHSISDSRTLEMCSKKTISSQEFVYVMSSKYPNTDYVNKERNCKCSVIVNSNNSKNQSTKSIKINMVIIHTELKPTEQLILISPDNYLLRNISKEAKHYEISLDKIQRTAFDLFSQIEANTRSGVYWVGFKSE